MILLAAHFEQPLTPDTDGPAVTALHAAAGPMLNEIPGVSARVVEVYRSPGLAVAWLDRGQFERGKPKPAVTPGLVTVMDGYETEAGAGAIGQQALAAAGRSWIDEAAGEGAGEPFAQSADGSYSLAFIRLPRDLGRPASHAQIRIRTDPAGSRPIYAAYKEGPAGRLLVAPEPKCFLADRELAGGVVPAAVLSMAFNSYLFDELTYWQNVRLLGPARELLVQKGAAKLTRYWSPVFDHAAAKPVELDEFEQVLCGAMQSHLSHFERPSIGLSGGVDSRLLLAGARRLAAPISLVSWSYEPDPRLDGDYNAASGVADSLRYAALEHGQPAPGGPVHLRWRMDVNRLAEQVERIVFINDGLIGYLGAYADREGLAAELGRHFDAILIGDQCYRGEDVVSTVPQAVEAIGVQPAATIARLKFLLKPDFAATALADYEQRVAQMVQSAEPQKHAHPQDLHDRLYWQVRVPRILTGPKALYRLYLDGCSPMLARPMIELSTRLRIDQRVDKSLLREATQRMAPEVMAVPYAATHSRVRWRKVFKEAGPLQTRLAELLLDGGSGFYDAFDRANVEAMTYAGIRAAQGIARPGGGGGVAGLFRRSRAAIMRRAVPAPLFLNLVTLNQWFRQFSSR